MHGVVDGWGEKSCLRGNGKKIELGRKKECSTVVVVDGIFLV